MSFDVETDHKPLVSLLSSRKNLDALSPRIQRFRMPLMRYMYTIANVSGKSLITADALSRAPQERPLTEAEELLTDEVTAQANLVVGALPATEKGLAEISARQLERVSTDYALLCRGLAQSSMLAIGVEAVPASAKRVDDPERVTP